MWAHNDNAHFSVAHVNVSAVVEMVQRALDAIEGGEVHATPPAGTLCPTATAPCTPGRGSDGYHSLATSARTDGRPVPWLWHKTLEEYGRRAYLDLRPNSSRLTAEFLREVKKLVQLPQYHRRGWQPVEPEAAVAQ